MRHIELWAWQPSDGDSHSHEWHRNDVGGASWEACWGCGAIRAQDWQHARVELSPDPEHDNGVLIDVVEGP